MVSRWIMRGTGVASTSNACGGGARVSSHGLTQHPPNAAVEADAPSATEHTDRTRLRSPAGPRKPAPRTLPQNSSSCFHDRHLEGPTQRRDNLGVEAVGERPPASLPRTQPARLPQRPRHRPPDDGCAAPPLFLSGHDDWFSFTYGSPLHTIGSPL